MKKKKNIIIRILIGTIGFVISFSFWYFYIINTIGLNGQYYGISLWFPDMKGWALLIVLTSLFSLIIYFLAVERLKEKHHLD